MICAGAGLIWFALPPSFHWMFWGNFRGLLGRRASKSETRANRFVPNGKAWYQMTLRGVIDRCGGDAGAFRPCQHLLAERMLGNGQNSCFRYANVSQAQMTSFSAVSMLEKSHDAAVSATCRLMQTLPLTP